MAQGAVFEGTEFPADLWEERVPKDLAGVQVIFWWVNPQNGKQQPDQDMLAASGGTGRFDFQNDPLQVSQIPMMLQTKGKSGNWWIDVHRPGEARYLFRWKIFLGTSPQQQHTLGGIVAGAYDRIMAGQGVPGAPGGPPPPPPGAAVFSKEYNAWVNPVSSTTVPGMTISGTQVASPEVQGLSQRLAGLESAERERSQQSALDRLAQQHREDLARMEAQRERERLDEKERSNIMLARIEQMGAVPRGASTLEIIASLAPVAAPLFTALVAQGQARDGQHQELMREIIRGQAVKPSVDPMMLELLKMQSGNRAGDAHLMEAMGRQALETASMFTNMFATMKEHEPEISPIAENATRVITNVAHELAGYFKARAQQAPQLTAGPKTKEEQAKESIAFMQGLSSDEKMALAQKLAEIAQEEIAKAGTLPPIVTPAPEVPSPTVAPAPETPAAPPVPTNGAVDGAVNGNAYAMAWMKEVGLPSEYHTKEWAKIISEIHDERDQEEMSSMLADHLFHLWQFDALPPGLECLDEDNLDESDLRSRFEPLKASLPIYQKNAAYVDLVFDGAVRTFLTAVEEASQEEGVEVAAN